MIDHVWTILCSRAVIDRDTNNMSLLEVIEQLTLGDASPPVEGEGLAPIQLELVTLWTRREMMNQRAGGLASGSIGHPASSTRSPANTTLT
jgi:hypothetical protein